MTTTTTELGIDLETIRLVRRQLLSNGYIQCFDVEGRTFYISPDANNSHRYKWQGFLLTDEFYIYV